jgi:hypothetical protein
VAGFPKGGRRSCHSSECSLEVPEHESYHIPLFYTAVCQQKEARLHFLRDKGFVALFNPHLLLLFLYLATFYTLSLCPYKFIIFIRSIFPTKKLFGDPSSMRFKIRALLIFEKFFSTHIFTDTGIYFKTKENILGSC